MRNEITQQKASARFSTLCGSRARHRLDITRGEASCFVPLDEVNRLMRRRSGIASPRVPGLVDAVALAPYLSLLQQLVLVRVVCEGIMLPPRFLDLVALEHIARRPLSELPKCR